MSGPLEVQHSLGDTHLLVTRPLPVKGVGGEPAPTRGPLSPAQTLGAGLTFFSIKWKIQQP